MKRRERWQKVLQSESDRWSKKSYDQLRAELKDGAQYEVLLDSITHQVEVEILEDTPEYLHVSIAVDDGTLPYSISPVTSSFIRKVT